MKAQHTGKQHDANQRNLIVIEVNFQNIYSIKLENLKKGWISRCI